MPNAIYYAKYKEKWNIDRDAFLKEKERINTAVKHKYHNDENYRLKCLEYSKNKLKEKIHE